MSAPSSTSEARTESPSDSRVAEARAQGHSPRAVLMGLAATSVVLSVLTALSAGDLVRTLQHLLRAPMQALANGASISASDVPLALLSRFGAGLGGVLALCLVSMLLARAVAQGFIFRVGRPARPARFAAVARTRWISVCLSAVMAGVVLGSALPWSLRAEVQELQARLSSLTLRVAAVLALVALIDALLARAAWWRSLWMTRNERRNEDREAYGTPEARAARDRVRRERHAEAPTRSRS